MRETIKISYKIRKKYRIYLHSVNETLYAIEHDKDDEYRNKYGQNFENAKDNDFEKFYICVYDDDKKELQVTDNIAKLYLKLLEDKDGIVVYRDEIK